MGSMWTPSFSPAKNAAATPIAAASVIAALTNTIRRSTTYTDRKPRTVPAASAHRSGSRNSSNAPQNASQAGRSPPTVHLHRAVVADEVGVDEHFLGRPEDDDLVLPVEIQDLVGVRAAQLDVVGDDHHPEPAVLDVPHQPLERPPLGDDVHRRGRLVEQAQPRRGGE